MKKQEPRTKKNHESTSTVLTRKQRGIFRIVTLLITPLFFIVLVETMLRIIGHGIPSDFFVKWTSEAEIVYIANERYTEHFVPPALSRSPEFSAIGTKSDFTIRILVVGGSAAFGDPDPAFGFCRLLERLLNEHSEGTTFEVINAAITSMNSYVAKNIVQDSAGHGVDVFLVYMGNNEIVGPYGPSSLPSRLGANPVLLNAAIWFKKETRIGQLLKNISYSVDNGAEGREKWRGMEAFLENLVPHDDPRLAISYKNYQSNLESIISSAREQNALALIATVPTNLRSCPPFASKHSVGLGASALKDWEQKFESGLTFQESGDYESALEEFSEAQKIDAEYAELLFAIARCQETLGQFAAAEENYSLARDLDALRFRADSRINEIVRDVVSKSPTSQVRLLDLEKVMKDDSRVGIPGEKLFVDHVHLTFRGNFLAALSTMDLLQQSLPSVEMAPVSKSLEELYELVRQSLLYDGVAEYGTSTTMYRRKTIPPFTAQAEHDSELRNLKNQLTEDRSFLKDYTLGLETQRQEVSNHPNDVYLLTRYSDSLIASGKPDEALGVFREAFEREPYNKSIITEYAKLLALSGNESRAMELLTIPNTPFPTEPEKAMYILGTEYIYAQNIVAAKKVFEELNRIDPDNIEYLNNLSAAAASFNDTEAQRKYLERALELDPYSPRTMTNFGNYYVRQKQPEKAAEWFTKAVNAYPYQHLSQFGLGTQSLLTGDTQTSLTHLEEAVKLKPDFIEGYQILVRIAQEMGDNEAAERYSRLAEIFNEPVKPF